MPPVFHFKGFTSSTAFSHHAVLFSCCCAASNEAAFNSKIMSDYEIIAFYREKNQKTGKFHWQHMEEERMLAICKRITDNSRRGEDRKAAAGLALDVLNFKQPTQSKSKKQKP